MDLAPTYHKLLICVQKIHHILVITNSNVKNRKKNCVFANTVYEKMVMFPMTYFKVRVKRSTTKA